MILKLELGFFYLVLGVILSFSIGVTLIALIGFFKSIFKLFRYKTAWFSAFTFLIVAYIGLVFVFGVFPLAGNIGDQTGYKMQNVLLISAFIPGLFTWSYPISIMQIGSIELIKTKTYKSYGFVWGFLVYYACGLFGAFMVFNYLISHLSLGWLVSSIVLYPITFVAAPIYMLFVDGIWLPIVLNFGGIYFGGFLMSLSSDD
jgi:hypothetical protein